MDQIEREIFIAAPQERVWAVLTEADHIAQWFGDSAEVDLRPGGTARFGWKEHGIAHIAIEAVTPPDFFAYRWARPTGVDPVAGNSTLVEFTLMPDGDGTRLRVVESGFDSLDEPAEARLKAAEENTEGWRSELDELRAYAEKLTG